MPRKKPPPKPWKRMCRADEIPMTDEQVTEHIRIARENHGVIMTPDDIRHAMRCDEVWMNTRYQCAVTYVDKDRYGPLHLSIKRLDRKVIHDWRDLQQIKNEVAGDEREALELYPAESRVVDTANQYHLWVAPDGAVLPVGWKSGRFVSDEVGKSGARQRPRSAK